MAGQGIKAVTKRLLRQAGWELQRFDAEGSYAKRRQLLLISEKVDAVLDVGAHAGEFGQSLRHGGYRGGIVSFEPVGSLHDRLCAAADGDDSWACRRLAVGDRSGEVEIHVSGNDGFSSSIREMASAHEVADPGSSYVRSEMVEVTTLDRLSEDVLDPCSRALLKVDTQGYESEVLSGARSTLGRCRLVELELGLVELYEGQTLFAELTVWMEAEGFSLTDIEPGFRDQRTGQLLQVDALFLRSDSCQAAAVG